MRKIKSERIAYICVVCRSGSSPNMRVLDQTMGHIGFGTVDTQRALIPWFGDDYIIYAPKLAPINIVNACSLRVGMPAMIPFQQYSYVLTYLFNLVCIGITIHCYNKLTFVNERVGLETIQITIHRRGYHATPFKFTISAIADLPLDVAFQQRLQQYYVRRTIARPK